MSRIIKNLACVFAVSALFTGAAYAQEFGNNEETFNALMEQGKPLYIDQCEACHGDEGQGGVGTALKNSPIVKSRPGLINQILFGANDHGMPPFADLLNDEEVAAVSTYVRNAFGNSEGIVLPRSVELRRSSTQ